MIAFAAAMPGEKKAGYALAVLFAINAVNFYDRQILGALGEPIRREWRLSDAELGALGTAFTLLYAFAGVPLGRLSDRASRTRILSAGVFVWSLLTGLSGAARSFWQLFVLRLGVGLGEAACAPAATSLIGDLFPAERRARALSVFMLGLPIGIAASYAVSSTVAQAWGWRSAFYVAALPGFVCAAAALLIAEPRRGVAESGGAGVPRREGSPYLSILRIPTMGWLILSGAVHNFTLYAISSFLSPYLMRYHGTTLRGAGLVSMMVYGVGGGLGLLLGGMAADAAVRRRADGRMLVAAGALLGSVPLLFLALARTPGDTLGFGLLTGGSIVLMYVYYPAVYAAIQDVVGPARRGTAMALYFLAMYVLGASMGPVATGLLSDHFTAKAARAAGVADMTPQTLEPFRAAGLQAAMEVLPVLGVLLTFVLFAASRTIARDRDRLHASTGRGPDSAVDPLDPHRRVKAYAGVGILTSGGAVLPCQFAAHQRGDGTIVIDVETDDTTPMRTWDWDAQIVGTTDTGQRILSQRAHIVNSNFTIGEHEGPNTTLRLIAAGMDVSVPGHATMFRYGLTNLRKILGNEWHEYTTPAGHEGGRLRPHLRLGQFDVVIEHRPDAEAVLKELAVTHGVALTAEATIEATPEEAAAADETIRKLCHLLTLGQGSAVCWIYRDSIDARGQAIATFCGNALTKPYNSAHILISDDDMCSFVQATYPAWDEADTKWEIRNAILGYTDAKLQVDYQELRGLKMAVVIEHLKRVYLERTGRAYILPSGLFEGMFESFRRRTMKLLRELFPAETGETLGSLTAGLKGLNRTSFKEALKGVAADLGLTLRKEEMQTLTPIRDRLVHAMQFSKDVELTTYQQYDLLTTFAGRLILAALRYDGQYYDWTTRPPVLVKLERQPPADNLGPSA